MVDQRQELAVILCTVSTLPQADPDLPSLDEQEATCRRYCDQVGDLVVEVIRIEYSRYYSRLDRLCQANARYAHLVELIETEQITKVVVERYDRLYRKGALQGQICALADEHGVWLYSVREPTQRGDDQSAMWIRTIFGLTAEQDVRNLIAKRRRGMLGRIKRQKTVSFQAPYGYRVEGRRREARLVVSDEERRWVRWIFERRAEGRGYVWIARELNARSVPGPRGEAWSVGTLRHLLRNPTYVGRVRQREWARPRGGSNRRLASLPRSDQCRHLWSPPEVVHDDGLEVRTHTCARCGRPLLTEFVGPGAHEPIISSQLWEAAQRVNDARRRDYSRRDRPRRLYTGLVRCALCGDAMCYHDAKGTLVLRCSRYVRQTTTEGLRPCRPNAYPVRVLHRYVLDTLKTALADPEAWARQFQDHDAERLRQQRLADIRRELASLEVRRRNVMQAIEIAPSGREDLVRRYDMLNQQRQRCLAETQGLEQDAERLGRFRSLLIEWQHAAADLDRRSDEDLRPILAQLVSRILLERGKPPVIIWAALEADSPGPNLRPIPAPTSEVVT